MEKMPNSEIELVLSLIRKGEDNETIAKITKRSVGCIRDFRQRYEWLKKEWKFRRNH